MEHILIYTYALLIRLDIGIGRKGHLTQNVLAVCDFDMEFVYILTGWEVRIGKIRRNTFSTALDNFIRESHWLRISTGEALADALMRDSCACKADLRSNFSLEETPRISASKASISASEGCISQVEDIP